MNNYKDQNEGQEAAIAVKVFGLRKEELEDEDLIKQIEDQVEHQLELIDIASIVKDNVFFSFPWDPSVTSAEIPILVDVTSYSEGDDLISDKGAFVHRIHTALGIAFNAIKEYGADRDYIIPEERKIAVTFSERSAFWVAQGG